MHTTGVAGTGEEDSRKEGVQWRKVVDALHRGRHSYETLSSPDERLLGVVGSDAVIGGERGLLHMDVRELDSALSNPPLHPSSLLVAALTRLASWLSGVDWANMNSKHSHIENVRRVADTDSVAADRRRTARVLKEAVTRAQVDTVEMARTGRVAYTRKLLSRVEATQVRVTALQPETEMAGVTREERLVVYRKRVLSSIRASGEELDYVIWLDMDLRGLDVSAAVSELGAAWLAGYDVVCASGVKYNGWYYDSFATVLDDGSFLYGVDPVAISNEMTDFRFRQVRSCFGGFAAYDWRTLSASRCDYSHFARAYANNRMFARFCDDHPLAVRTCEHLPLNFCLYQSGAQLAIATRMFSYYGTRDSHG